MNHALSLTARVGSLSLWTVKQGAAVGSCPNRRHGMNLGA